MNREIKFRAWNIEEKKMSQPFGFEDIDGEDGHEGYIQTEGEQWEQIEINDIIRKIEILMQYTGLKDKNGLTEIYENDIIDSNGKIKGNIYEINPKETDLVIQGFGTKDWFTTYQKAMERGCQNAE